MGQKLFIYIFVDFNLAKNKFSQGRLVRIEIRIIRRIIVVTSLKWWTWLVPLLASLLWTVPVVVVIEVGAVFTGFGAVVPQMSFITTDFAREVRFHGKGIVFSMLLEFGPFAEILQ